MSMKLQLKVIPSSSRDEISGWLGDTLKLKVKAPPEKGKANKAVIRVLEKSLALSKGSVRIDNGQTSVRKTVYIDTPDEALVRQKIDAICNK